MVYRFESKYGECNFGWDITVPMIGVINSNSRENSKLIYGQQSLVTGTKEARYCIVTIV